MGYKIEIKKSALKEIQELPNNLKLKVKASITALSKNPMPNGYKKLKGRQNDYRIRIGNYRIVYQIKTDIVVVFVIKVGHRKDIYE